jgi:hypothetical protein
VGREYPDLFVVFYWHFLRQGYRCRLFHIYSGLWCLGIVCLEDAEAIDVTPCIEDDEMRESDLRPSLKSTAVRTRESGKDLGPPPDGGFQAWSQVALAHFVIS